MLYCFLIKLVLQLKKFEQNYTDDVDKKMNPACTAREEIEESEDEESNIDDVSKNIASNMSIVDGETLAKSEGKSNESGAKFDIQSSLPEVVFLDQQSCDTAYIFILLLINEFFSPQIL